MSLKISAIQETINKTLVAIHEGREHVEEIARGTLEEVKRLEQEHASLQEECLQAIETVERLDAELRQARKHLMEVNQAVNKSSEADMMRAYDAAQRLQFEYAQWQERETQLRIRRDDIARRLKSLRVTAHQAELLTMKFRNVSEYLSVELQDLSTTVQTAQLQSLLGMQILQLQEDERRWLAQKIHDGPMQSLASVAMRAQLSQPVVPGAVDNVQQRLVEVISELRQVVFDLRPPLLDDLGLVPTLKRYAEQWSHSYQVTVRIHLVGLETTLSATQKVTAFRGVQEALANAAKHASATQVDITLLYGDDSLRIEVADDGKGIADMDWLGWVESGKLGLSLCRQRLSLLGGTLDVLPLEPCGTKLVIRLPMTGGAAS